MKKHQPPADLLRLWLAGDKRKALRLAASWPELGKHREAIKRGASACTREGAKFYREQGDDPALFITLGFAAIAERYGITDAVIEAFKKREEEAVTLCGAANCSNPRPAGEQVCAACKEKILKELSQ